MEENNLTAMTDNSNDDLLLNSFFSENTINVPDDGFTDRVMQRLPERKNRLAQVWTWLCAVAGIVFLVATKSWLTIYSLLKNMLLGIIPDHLSHVTLAPYIIAMIIISALMGYSLAKETTYK